MTDSTDRQQGGEGHFTRTISHEFWRGVPVLAYHWTINDPGHPIEGLRKRHGIAYHWSTGPKDAKRLVAADDAERLVTYLRTRLDDAYKALRSLAEGNLGDMPWQANYATIKQVARNALPSDGEGARA